MTLVEQKQFRWHQLCQIGPKARVGKGSSFQTKFGGIDSEWFSIFRGRKWSFWGIPRFTEESIPRLRTEGNGMEKLVLQKILLQQTVFFRDREFREFVSIFVPQNGIPSCFLFPGTAGVLPEQTICSIFSVFRRILVTFFCQKFPTLLRALSRQALILQASCSHSLRASNIFFSFCCGLFMNHKKRQ